MFLQSVELLPAEQNGDYIWRIPAIAGLTRLDFSAPVTFFVGENGTGKSTLLEAIAAAYGFNPEGGSKNFLFSTADTHSALWQSLRLSKGAHRPTDSFFLRAESFYNVASEIDRLDEHSNCLYQSYGGRSLHEQSHGESFLALALNRFRGNGLYLLDEPEAALSVSRQLSLLTVMKQLVDGGSQLILATHSPILLAFPGAAIYEFGDGPIRPVSYEETESYRITSAFLQNRARFLDVLFSEEE